MEKVTISADVDFAAALLAHGLAHERGVTLADVLTYLVRRYVSDVAAGVVKRGELTAAPPNAKRGAAPARAPMTQPPRVGARSLSAAIRARRGARGARPQLRAEGRHPVPGLQKLQFRLQKRLQRLQNGGGKLQPPYWSNRRGTLWPILMQPG